MQSDIPLGEVYYSRAHYPNTRFQEEDLYVPEINF
jgi:hypothetical protein